MEIVDAGAPDAEAQLQVLWTPELADAFDYGSADAVWSYFLRCFSKLIDASGVTLIVYPTDGAPWTLYSAAFDDLDSKRINAYLSGAYLLDPFYEACTAAKRRGVCFLDEIAPAGFTESDYYVAFFSAYGLSDEVNLIVQCEDGVSLAISLGRTPGARRYGERTRRFLELHEAFLSAVALRTLQWRLDNASASFESAGSAFHARLKNGLSRFGTSVLTPREKEVVDCLLRGYSAKAAAEKLGVSDGTIRIHRHSSYRKLQVSSQSELFALVLDSLKKLPDAAEDDPLKHLGSGE